MNVTCGWQMRVAVHASDDRTELPNLNFKLRPKYPPIGSGSSFTLYRILRYDIARLLWMWGWVTRKCKLDQVHAGLLSTSDTACAEKDCAEPCWRLPSVCSCINPLGLLWQAFVVISSLICNICLCVFVCSFFPPMSWKLRLPQVKQRAVGLLLMF